MGTSTRYSGPGLGLVPSWVDEPAPAAADPGSGQQAEPSPGEGAPDAAPDPAGPAPRPAAPRPRISAAGAFGSAQGSFTRFARTGSRDAFTRSISKYVREGTKGGRNAAHRMSAPRQTGGRLLAFMRDVEARGATEALRKFNLQGLAGRPAAEAFLAMVDFIAPAGGSIDEAIARQALLQSVSDIADAGAFEDLTADQRKEFVADFVSRSIEGRILCDIGEKSITLPTDVEAIDRLEQQLHDFIHGAVKDSMGNRLEGLEGVHEPDMQVMIEDIYDAAFEMAATLAEAS